MARKFDRLSEKERRSPGAIQLLDDIVQAYVEEYDDASACRRQETKYRLVCSLKGADHIDAERSYLYLRELQIRSAPLNERVGMCRGFWEDIKALYGEDSYAASRIAAPLYLMCCEESGEYDEMRILCAEIIGIFDSSEDAEDLKLAALCRAFDGIYGSPQTDPDPLRVLCADAAERFGGNSELVLTLERELGMIYRRIGDPDMMLQCTAIHRQSCAEAIDALGAGHRLTLQLMCDLAEDLALTERFDEAASVLEGLEELCSQLPENIQKPDIDSAYFTLYSKRGDIVRAEKYAEKALTHAIEVCDGSDIAGKAFRAAAYAFLKHRSPERFRELSSAASDKLEAQFISCISRYDKNRTAYFGNKNSRGAYRIYSALALYYMTSGEPSQSDLFMIWEILCNEKAYLSDCELMHSALSRQPVYAGLIDELDRAVGENNAAATADCERKLLDALRRSSSPEYSDSVRISGVCDLLDASEILMDYYRLESPEGEEYCVFIAAEDGVRFVRLGRANKIDTEISALTENILQGTGAHNGDPAIPDCLRLGFDIIPSGERGTVYLCPDGELYRMPFDLLGEHRSCILTSAKHLARNKEAGAGPVSVPESVCVFGDPDFGATDRPPLERTGCLSPLPGTLIEAMLIDRCYGSRATLYLNKDANKINFAHAHADIMHIGTHARAEGMGYLYFSADDNNIGSALSHRCPDAVSGEQISGMDLSGTELVTLSACGTADGKLSDYVGVRSLRRAFQLAGAKRILATLWRIDDFSTVLMMKRFYEQYSLSGDARESLEQAKAYLKTATLGQLRRNDLPAIFELMLSRGQIDNYRRIRDRLALCDDDKILFAAPYYWAGFGLYE